MIGVTIHETDNWSPNAGAMQHARYLQGAGQNRSASWHYAVDDSLITCSIPEEEHAWHSGDGEKGIGNLQTIAIEICVNPNSDYETAKINAAWLAADILLRHHLTVASEHLFQHAHFAAKECPRRIRAEGKWEEFVATVQVFIQEPANLQEEPTSHVQKDGGRILIGSQSPNPFRTETLPF
jgi:N-acetylmuramoyl-L-alanine amidase